LEPAWQNAKLTFGVSRALGLAIIADIITIFDHLTLIPPLGFLTAIAS
jgi:hypothetical protein